ncbi:MAG: hypothetical protein HRF46_15540 [Acidobacteriota bacterium]|jgi:hypothetical protein
MDFARVIGLLVPVLDRHRVRWALCGGLALAAYGMGRTTFDVDLVADASGAEGVIAELERLGYETVHRSAGYSNHFHPDPALGRVDVVWVRGSTADTLFAQARPVPGPDGKPLLLPRPEHLAAMKAAAMASDPSRLYQDLADLRFLLTLPGVNRDEVRAHMARRGLESRYDELLATL